MHDILVAMSVMQHGSWEGIYQMLKDKIPVTDEEIRQAYAKLKCSALVLTDKDYPTAFKEVYRPPLCLFYRGDIGLLNRPRILGVVGARQASSYTLDTVAGLVGKTLEAASDIVVCSGMARGVDATAMRQAMARGLPVIGVMGSGINNPYPATSRDIYDYCAAGKGLVISEYPCEIEPKREHFPFRNRLIATLSHTLLAAQVGKRSGTSTTIKCALECGHNIMLIPQRLEESELTNELVRDGAELACSADDLVRSFR